MGDELDGPMYQARAFLADPAMDGSNPDFIPKGLELYRAQRDILSSVPSELAPYSDVLIKPFGDISAAMKKGGTSDWKFVAAPYSEAINAVTTICVREGTPVGDLDKKTAPAPPPTAEADAAAKAQADADAKAKAEADAAAAAAKAAAAAGTVSQRNALRSAKNYLDFTAFSRPGLIGQLEYEEYSAEDATWAVDHVTVNWSEQAAKSAKNYLEFTAFSRAGLVDQLLYEGFTPEEAEYGVSQTGL